MLTPGQIDWNKVAHDPILAQEITNGHAARMRYSRFRSAMLGLEPQRRNRTNANKSKVTKSKKEPKTKKEEPIKPDPSPDGASIPDVPMDPLQTIKHENQQLAPESQLVHAPFAGMSVPDAQAQLHTRLLTPCSDTDLLAAVGGYAPSPASDMVHSEGSYDFPSSAPCAHDQGPWQPNSPYSAFSLPYDLEGYSMGLCEHQHTHHHTEELYVPPAMVESDPNNVSVKHEDWDAHIH